MLLAPEHHILCIGKCRCGFIVFQRPDQHFHKSAGNQLIIHFDDFIRFAQFCITCRFVIRSTPFSNVLWTIVCKNLASDMTEAVEQCAANTVRHAEGDRLTVTLQETESEWFAEFRNNGKPPEEPVSESGS